MMLCARDSRPYSHKLHRLWVHPGAQLPMLPGRHMAALPAKNRQAAASIG